MSVAGAFITQAAIDCEGAFSSPPSYPHIIGFLDAKTIDFGDIIKTIARILQEWIDGSVACIQVIY